MYASLLLGGVFTAEGIYIRSQRLQLRHKPAHFIAAIARADIADIDEVVTSIDSGHERAKCRAVAVPTADYDLVPRPAFGLGPVGGAAGNIRRIQFFRNDAFK